MSKTADYPLITRFFSIVKSLKTCLHHLLNDSSVQVDVKNYAVLRTGLLFFTKFEILGDTKLTKSTSSNTFVNLEEVSLILKVYYKWLLKFVTSFISSCKQNLMDPICKTKINEALTVINEVNVNLKSINDPFRKISKVVKKSLFHIPPHSEKVDMEVHSKILQLDRTFEPWMTEMESFDPKKSLGKVLENPEKLKNVIGTMVEVWKDVFLGNFKTEILLDCLKKAEEFVDKVCPKLTMHQVIEDEKLEKEKLILGVELWPLYEFLFAIFALANQKGSGDQPEVGLLRKDVLEDFMQVLSIPPSTLALCKVSGESDGLLKSMAFYSLLRCFDKMKITKMDVLMLDHEKMNEQYKKVRI